MSHRKIIFYLKGCRTVDEYLHFLEDSFFEHVERENLAGESFAYMLEQWTSQGEAVELTGGDYGLYMQTVVYIREGERLAGIAPHSYFSFKNGTPDCIDPQVWNVYVFRNKHRPHGSQESDPSAE